MRKSGHILVAGLWVLSIVFLPLTLLADEGVAPARSVEKILTCGNAQLGARTEYVVLSEANMVVWTLQTITLKNSIHPNPIPLLLESKSLHIADYPHGAVLDSVILGWKCLKTAHGKHYIFLAYTCSSYSGSTRSASDESCNWDQILNTSGERIDDRQRVRLGINRAIGNQLQLQNTTED